MEITLTGTGSPLPDPNRAGPSTLVKADETRILVDAGRGVVMRLAGASTMPNQLSGVLITHLHSDHICALGDVITTHWIMSQGIATLPIHGPKGTAQYVSRVLDSLEPDIGYRISHHDLLRNGPMVEVTEHDGGDHFSIGDVQIECARTEHAPVAPTLGYRLAHRGVVAALVGDTIPCEGLAKLVESADVYVQTVIRDDIVRNIPSAMLQDILDYHSTVSQAGQTAAAGGVRTLVLTHMVPPPTPDQYDEWRAIAAKHFDGEVVIGDDLTTINAD
ncbi:MAG: ribonuclease Z [Actinobacteria bacterium]|nr:ribonuclease Z [Actinomycetota bacterium]